MISGYVYFIIGLIVGIAFCVGIPGLPGAIRQMVGQIRKYKSQLDQEKEEQQKIIKKKDVKKEWNDVGVEFYN